MAKSGRARKEKKKDFIKKRIKVGKVLKKPQNETITTFKSRSIHIIEQLVEKEAGANVTRKRYTITELCSRLNHTNSNQKMDACNGVKELLSKLSSQQIRTDLALLVASLSRCLLSDDVKLRTTVIRLLEAVIDKVTVSSLCPHFALLGRHLSCGLVSLHADVQASALQLLHMLLRKAPDLLHPHASSLLPNLLRLLGAKSKSGAILPKVFSQSLHGALPILSDKKNANKNNDNKKGKGGKANKKSGSKDGLKKKAGEGETGVVVKADQSGRQSTLVWQLDVLVLLTALLGHTASRSSTEYAVQDGELERPFGTYWQCLVRAMCDNTADSDEGQGLALLTQPDKLQLFCGIVLPLLHGLWRNMLPEGTSQAGGATVSNPSAHTLWCLSELQTVLASMVRTCTGRPATQCEWYVGLIKPIFGDLLHNHFPFYYCEVSAMASKRGKNKSKYDDRPSGSSDNLNLRLATVGVTFQLFEESSHYTLVHYVQELLSSEEKIGTYDMEAACQLITSLVNSFVPATGCLSKKRQLANDLDDQPLTKRGRVADDLLQAAMGCYQKQHPLKKERRHLLALLLQLTDADHRHLNGLPSVREWCQCLVSEAESCNQLPLSLLSTLHQLLLRRCPGALPPMEKRASISDNVLRHAKAVPTEERENFLRFMNK